TRLGWIAVVHRPPPATAALAAIEPLRNVRRVRPRAGAAPGRNVGMDASSEFAPGLPWRPWRRLSLREEGLPPGGGSSDGGVAGALQIAGLSWRTALAEGAQAPKRSRCSGGMSGFSRRTLSSWTAQLLPSGSAKPKN